MSALRPRLLAVHMSGAMPYRSISRPVKSDHATALGLAFVIGIIGAFILGVL